MMISLTGVTKYFGSRRAIQSLSLEVPRGSICGLLGHNGAGKSTVIGMLLGQVYPTTGQVRINGYDVQTDRRHALSKVGAIFETPAFYDYLSGRRNLQIYSEYSALTDPVRLQEIIRVVGLADRIEERVAVYSHGMRQRLALAQALLPKPELLILDEPTEGLDPEGIHAMRNLVWQLHRDWNLTIFISSHLLSEMEQWCTQLAVLREGQLLFAGDWRQRAAAAPRVRIKVDRQAEAERGLAAAGLATASDSGGGICLQPGVSLAAVTTWLVQQGFQVEQITPVALSLEDFYLATTHRGQKVGAP